MNARSLSLAALLSSVKVGQQGWDDALTVPEPHDIRTLAQKLDVKSTKHSEPAKKNLGNRTSDYSVPSDTSTYPT
jgi:hypothetical protein